MLWTDADDAIAKIKEVKALVSRTYSKFKYSIDYLTGKVTVEKIPKYRKINVLKAQRLIYRYDKQFFEDY